MLAFVKIFFTKSFKIMEENKKKSESWYHLHRKLKNEELKSLKSKKWFHLYRRVRNEYLMRITSIVWGSLVESREKYKNFYVSKEWAFELYNITGIKKDIRKCKDLIHITSTPCESLAEALEIYKSQWGGREFIITGITRNTLQDISKNYPVHIRYRIENKGKKVRYIGKLYSFILEERRRRELERLANIMKHKPYRKQLRGRWQFCPFGYVPARRVFVSERTYFWQRCDWSKLAKLSLKEPESSLDIEANKQPLPNTQLSLF